MPPVDLIQLTEILRHHIGLDHLPEFVHGDIQKPNLADILGCAESIETLYGQEVSAREIVGIVHPPFNTWLEFLMSGMDWDRDKFDNIINLALANPDYYGSDCDKDGWSFTCIDGLYYTQNGHHRTVIAKLMERAGSISVVRNVTVEYICYNAELFEQVGKVRELFRGLGKISVHRTSTGRHFTFNPVVKFCIPLMIELDSAQNLTRIKAIRAFLSLIKLSLYAKIKRIFGC